MHHRARHATENKRPAYAVVGRYTRVQLMTSTHFDHVLANRPNLLEVPSHLIIEKRKPVRDPKLEDAAGASEPIIAERTSNDCNIRLTRDSTSAG